jgi:DNA-directed RNA polymerase specialized sigma subunit
MKQLKKKYHRPWLNATGVEIPTADLKPIVRDWSASTWEAYLKWYEHGRKDALVSPEAYAILGDEQTESIFEQFAQNSSQEVRRLCEQVLSLLPDIEALVLRRYFLEGRTEVEIAFEQKRSQTGVNLIKNRALSRLKRGNSGDGMFARRFMKGDEFSGVADEPSIWDEPLAEKIKEARRYDPENHNAEFEAIKSSCVREALKELPELARRILYLRYWCDLSVNQTARILKRGVNVVEQIEFTSISKVKRGALAFETGTTFGGAKC